MSRLIDDLLAFSRMGRAELINSTIDLNDLFKETLTTLKDDINERDIIWNIHSLPTIRGDKAMLQIVFTNLVSNALKYTRTRNQARIEIGSVFNPDETVIFVRDNGVGFDMRYLNKLFSLFQRLHRAEEFEGTGVGLANVRRIIHRHGGKTWAEGVLGEGTSFYFSIPKSIPKSIPEDD